MPGKPFRRGREWYVVVEGPRDPTRLDDKGRPKRAQVWLHAPTRREVIDLQTKALREIATGTALDPTKVSVAEYLAHWLETVVRPGLAILTYERHEATIRNHLVPALGGVPLTKLSAAHLAKLYGDLREQGYAANTIRNVHGCLHAALTRAVQWRMIPFNPADQIDKPRADGTPPPLWDEDALARFLDLIPGRRFAPHYLVTLNTGMRMGEVLGLHWADLDLARGRLALQRQQITSRRFGRMETPTKGRRARAITLTAETVAALRAHRKAQAEERLAAGPTWQDGDRVFPNGTGGPLSERTIKADWDRSLSRWDLPPMRFHGLRHLHATYLLVAGVHPKVVSERLGHATTAITMERYSHVTPSLQEGAAEAFAATLAAVRGQGRRERQAGEDGG